MENNTPSKNSRRLSRRISKNITSKLSDEDSLKFNKEIKLTRRLSRKSSINIKPEEVYIDDLVEIGQGFTHIANIIEVKKLKEIKFKEKFASERLKQSEQIELLNLFINTPIMKSITLLRITRTTMGSLGASILSKSIHLINLTELNLDYNDIGDKGVMEISKSNNFKLVKILCLEGNEIGLNGIIELSRSENFKKLEKLYLNENEVCDKGIKELKNSGKLKNLVELHLSLNNVGEEGIGQMTSVFQNLEVLDLADNAIGPNGLDNKALISIAESINLRTLKKLTLSCNVEINDKGLITIARSKNLKSLEELYLDLTDITDEGLKEISKSNNFESLKKLSLTDTLINYEMLETLKSSMPNIDVIGTNIDELSSVDSGSPDIDFLQYSPCKKQTGSSSFKLSENPTI